MTTVGFIGLGRMGLPMAENLVAAGHEVHGFDLADDRLESLAESGGHAAESAAEAVAGREVVVTVLRTPAQVEAVAEEILPAIDEGAVYVDMSSIDPVTARSLAERAEERGVRAVDAPVSGGTTGAADGTLSIMIGGADDDVARVEPLFEAMGANLFHVGGTGTGQAAKLANQMSVGVQCVLISEVFQFGDEVGIDRETLYDLLVESLGRTGILEAKGERLLTGDFEPGFDIELQTKDLRLATEAAEEFDVPVQVVGAALQEFVRARRQGLGDRDHLGVHELMER